MRNLLSEVSLSCLLHLSENHGADFFGRLYGDEFRAQGSQDSGTDEVASLPFVVDMNGRLSIFLQHVERPVL